MKRNNCKICRRLGISVCFSRKCAIVKKPYPPGVQGRKRKRGLSEYGKELREKQILQHWYNVGAKQLANYVRDTLRHRTKVQDAGEILISKLERRLDNVVFRMGFASSRVQARQMVSHGHFLVNGKKTNIPSFQVDKEDIVSLSDKSRKKIIFQNLLPALKKHKAPSWIEFDPEKMEGKITALPNLEEVNPPADIAAIFEFYSR